MNTALKQPLIVITIKTNMVVGEISVGCTNPEEAFE